MPRPLEVVEGTQEGEEHEKGKCPKEAEVEQVLDETVKEVKKIEKKLAA